MHNACGPFEGKRVTLLGLGLLGRGVGDAKFLAHCGANVLITDKKPEAELADSVAVLKQFPNVSFRLGGHDLEDFKNCDLVIKAAGVPIRSPEIAAAHSLGVPVAMSTALFAKYAAEAGATIVGVTGTRGKSTVSHMIYHSLICANKRTVLGGNVRGLSTLALLPQIERGDIAVLELDSWQLQGFGDLGISPHISVFTNLMPDHLNYYQSMDEYFADKANIFAFQKPGDTLVVGQGIAARVRAAHPPAEPIIPGALAPDWMLQIPGEHNRENASLAAAALLALGLNIAEIRGGLESFEGVEGRLQYIGEVHGAKIYNDNNATTPEATITALKALSRPGDRISRLALIAGGSEKGLALDTLIAEIRARVSQLIVLVHPQYEGSARFMRELDAAGITYDRADSLSVAVGLSLEDARAGDTVLFSPGFASFGMFKNEYERNDQFVRLIQAQLKA